MSKYQDKIVEALKSGSILQCTEGVNYKTWLVHPDGTSEYIRRNSANKICEKYDNMLIFGDLCGIRWRK